MPETFLKYPKRRVQKWTREATNTPRRGAVTKKSVLEAICANIPEIREYEIKGQDEVRLFAGSATQPLKITISDKDNTDLILFSVAFEFHIDGPGGVFEDVVEFLEGSFAKKRLI